MRSARRRRVARRTRGRVAGGIIRRGIHAAEPIDPIDPVEESAIIGEL